MVKRFIIAAIIVGLFLGGVGWFNLVFKPKMIGEFMAKMVPPPATVTAETARSESWTDRVRAIGTVVAIEGVDVAPQLGGLVTEYFFDSGQDVEKGQKLVKLDTSVEEADLADHQATLQQTNLDFDRQSKLVKTSAVSQATLDATIAKRDSAAAAVQKTRAIIAQKNIAAPFAGRLGLRRVEKGQYVSAGQALVWLQALDPIWVDFPVPEAAIGELAVGSRIELMTDAFPAQVFKGEVEAFDAKLGPDTRTLMVRARLPNPDRNLLPGMFANVAVLAGGAKDYVTVPRTAVTYGLYGDSVWVVKAGGDKPAAAGAPTASAEPVGSAIAADNTPTGAVPAEPALTAERRFVRVGPSEGDRIAILEGVEAGEEVVTSGQLKLQPGATIKVDNSGALKPPAELPKQ
jgi:membrane fusion protein (multidrug efflux system)